MVNNLFIIINYFYVANLYTIINKLFTKKMIFLLIVLKVDMNLNKNLKMGYFCTKPNNNLRILGPILGPIHFL